MSKRVDEAANLRGQGLTLLGVAKFMGISKSTAGHHVSSSQRRSFSEREKELAKLLAEYQGLLRSDFIALVATKFGIKFRTAETHFYNFLRNARNWGFCGENLQSLREWVAKGGANVTSDVVSELAAQKSFVMRPDFFEKLEKLGEIQKEFLLAVAVVAARREKIESASVARASGDRISSDAVKIIENDLMETLSLKRGNEIMLAALFFKAVVDARDVSVSKKPRPVVPVPV